MEAASLALHGRSFTESLYMYVHPSSLSPPPQSTSLQVSPLGFFTVQFLRDRHVFEPTPAESKESGGTNNGGRTGGCHLSIVHRPYACRLVPAHLTVPPPASQSPPSEIPFAPGTPTTSPPAFRPRSRYSPDCFCIVSCGVILTATVRPYQALFV